MNRVGMCLVAGVLLAAAGVRDATPQEAGDPGQADQWALMRIGAPAAWPTGTGTGTTIAIIDTGVDPDHEDLAGQVVASVNCVGADDDPDQCRDSGADDVGHGTHVAGIAAAANNGVGVASVAPGARIMSVKVLESVDDGEGDDDDGDGDLHDDGAAAGNASDVRAGVRWAVSHGADVINLSLGSDVAILNLFGSALEEAINEAWRAGVIPVVAAGNDALFPTGYHSVDALVVTATDREDEQASYASSLAGAEWGIAAPGGDGREAAGQILSTWWHPTRNDQYGHMAGTSMAAPHVTGAAAVLLSLGATPAQAVDRLLTTAVDLGPAGNDNRFGAGRLDVAAAVSSYAQPTPAATTPEAGAPRVVEAEPPPATPPARVQGSRAVAPPASGAAPAGAAENPAPAPPAPAGPVGATEVADPARSPSRRPSAGGPWADEVTGPALVATLLFTAAAGAWVARLRSLQRRLPRSSLRV